ncbi:hypothetical protein CF335_g5769 [Tilletia laevis]|nr:hypothetical protein CF335_g5769 [Tilletia laevis]
MSNRTDKAIYERGSAGVANWLGAWLEMAEVEYHFLTSVLDASSNQYGSSQNHHSEVSATLAAYLRNTFARALAPSLGFLNSTLSALHPHIRKNLATHMLFLLDVIGRHLSLSSFSTTMPFQSHSQRLSRLQSVLPQPTSHMIPARKPRRLTRRRRRDELDADGADCYTADSEQLYGSTISEPAMNMAHNDLPTFSDPYALQRASHQVQEFMDLYDGNNDDYGDGPGFGFVEDYGNDGSGSRYPQSDPSDEYDSDEGAVDIHGNPILVQNFNPRRCPLPRSNKETTRRRFAAWHQASNVIFKTAYDTDPTPRFPALPVISCDCPLDAPRHSLSIIHVYDIGKPMVVAGRTCSLIKSLISIGFFPSSPSAPRVAFTIRLLRLYQTLLNQVGMPANNMAATVQTLMRLEPTFQRSYSALTTGDVLRRQLSSAVTWMTVVERYAQQMATEVARWTPSRPSLVDDDLHLTLYDLIESCPACFQAFATPTRLDSQTLRSQLPHDAADLIHPRVGTWPAPTFGLDRDSPQVIVAIDGNFTQKRRRRADVINAQPMPPRRFLSARQSIAAERAWQNALGNDPDKESCVAISARKLMKRLNTALSTHFQALGRYPPVLEWDTLLKGEQFKLVEHWACADNPSLDDLPWWTNPSTAKAINAFEELLRAVEENERLEHERSSALAWIDNRIMRTGELRHTHSVYRDEHTRATALKNYWLGSAPAEDILFPSGVPIDHNTLSSDQADEVEVDIDVELEAQVARLAT